jgi:hypothetical protein
MIAVYSQGVIRLAALACVVAGCGRFGFDSLGAADAPRADMPIDVPPPTGPFGAAVPVPGVNTTSDEDDPSLTGDQFELYFNSNRAGGTGGNDIWVATRGQLDEVWSGFRAVSELNTTGDDATPDVSRDGLTLYWSSSGAAGAKDLWFATRPDRQALWGTKQRIVELASAADEAGPATTPDALNIYFARDPSGTDDIYTSTRSSATDMWSVPMPVDALNVAGVLDSEPFVNDTNTFIVWYSARSGNNDLWSARRTLPTDPWGPATPISELNTTTNAEGDPWLSPDEHVIYFMRNNDLYMATR